MNGLTYQAVVKTPHGYRVGELTVIVEKGLISGKMRLHDFAEHYAGTIREDGSIQLAMNRIVDSSSISCTGIGRISLHCIHISVECEDFVYEIDGTVQKL